MNKNAHPFWQIIRTVPDFPKQGIEFYDITPLLRHHVKEITQSLLAVLPEDLLAQLDCFVAIEARGFVLASLLAGHTGKGLMVVRKAGKLPPPVTKQSYILEYGEDTLEIQADVEPAKVLLVDDILATGGTLNATAKLCQSAGHQVLGALVLLDLVALHPTLEIAVHRVLTA